MQREYSVHLETVCQRYFWIHYLKHQDLISNIYTNDI